MRSGLGNDHGGQWRNGWVRCADPQPIAEVVPERQAKLLAGLREAQHAVARLASVAAHRAPGNLPLDDKAAQIAFRRIGVERDLRPLQNPQQFRLAAPEAKQQFVEIAIAGADRENPVEARLQALGHSRVRSSSIGLESFVKVPDELAQGLDVLHLAGRGRHQLVQQPFGMDPTQRVCTNPKLPGIVGDDHRVSNQAMMADGAPYAGLSERPKRLRVEDVDAMFGEMLEEGHPVGKSQRFMGVQPGSKGRVDLPVFQQRESGVVENIVLIVTAQQGEEVQTRLRRRRSKGCEMLAANMRRMEIAVGVTGTGVVDRDIGRRDEAGMQHGGILGVETIQPLCQEPHHLALRYFDANVVEQRRHSLRRDLPMRMQHQTKPPQIGSKATSYPRRQLCCDGLPLWRHPALPPVTNHLDLEHQIPDKAVLVALKARSVRHTGRQHLFTGHPLRVVLRPSRPERRILGRERLVTRCLFHPRRSEGWAGWQVFKPRNLVTQKLIVDLQPGVLEPELIVLIAKPLVFGFELLNPGVCPISPLHQTGHELAQRLQRQRVGMLGHGQAALRHHGSES